MFSFAQFNMSAKKIENDIYDIPLNISDILHICNEYNALGLSIQNQINYIVEFGVDESVNNKYVKLENLPHILNFLEKLSENVYFGDAVFQAQEIIFNIKVYIENIKTLHLKSLN